MKEAERLINLIYTMLFFEENRLDYEVKNSFYILKQMNNDLHYIEKYKQCVQRYEDFKIFQRKMFELLRRF